MKECSTKSCCETGTCETVCESDMEQECHDGQESFFLELADRAWIEVLKEKIKERIREQDDKYLTELAQIIAEGNDMRWKHKMAGKKNCHEFEERLCSFFGREK